MFPGYTASPEYLRQEHAAVKQMLTLGVALGDPVDLTPDQQRGGHMGCAYHLVVTATGEDEDGGSASMLRGYLTDGTYPGHPGDYTLVPIKGRTAFHPSHTPDEPRDFGEESTGIVWCRACDHLLYSDGGPANTSAAAAPCTGTKAP